MKKAVLPLICCVLFCIFAGSAFSETTNEIQQEPSTTKLNEGTAISNEASDNATFSDESGFEDEFDDFADFEEEFAEMEVQVWDPLEGYNRVMTDVNDFLYLNILDPVSRGWSYIPKGARLSVDRFFTNLMYPIRVVNNLLQLKIIGAGEETARFAINSTIGLFGLFDPAKAIFDLKPHSEDFGQTLGYYGVGGGPHIVIPVFGPSNLRDAIGDFGFDSKYLHPRKELDSLNERISSIVVEEVNWTSLHLGEYQTMRDNSIEWYIFLRDAYEQKRIKEIKE